MANTTPVQITFNDKPKAIIEKMNGLLSQRDRNNAIRKRYKWLPWLLILGGLPFIGIDLLLAYVFGYGPCLFVTVTAAMWFSAIVVFIVLLRARVLEFPPRFQTALSIINTLRDDVAPKRDFYGQLDLSGIQQPSKLASETPNALGLTIQRYRDEWLELKAKLYDGNMLRMSALERSKVRKGYFKRGKISGKMKWKAPVVKENRNQLQVRLSVNPQVYQIVPGQGPSVGQRFGAYLIDSINFDSSTPDGGIITLSASTLNKDISDADILNILKNMYGALSRKDK
jgi:hypothetical protein